MKKIGIVIVLLMLIVAMLAACTASPTPTAPADEGTTSAPEGTSNLEASLALSIDGVVGTDGQPLVQTKENFVIPPRPDNPEALPETDLMHWYDMAFAGYNASEKVNQPVSPADGCIGKKVVYIVNGDHPAITAMSHGAQMAADVFQMEFEAKSPNWDLNVQNQMIDQAINDRPDVIILLALDPNAAVQQYRKINQAGIPVIGANMLPDAEGMQYLLSWSGPDDFGQMKLLAEFAGDSLGGEGGVCYMTHNPGGSPYYARFSYYQAALAEMYPNMKTLDVQSPGFEADKARQVASDWITRFGDELKLIQLADDSAQAVGVIEALQAANRSDVMVTAAGNSKVGMDGIIDGGIYAITRQTVEGDGALAVTIAANWFNGKDVEPVYILPQEIITKENVENFLPAQW